jgi:D-tyrosyl-tRNA(Tyr) deacylase
MIGLLQRVARARVDIDGAVVAEIGPGLVILVGVERGDGARQAARLAERLLAYRVFPDERQRMNRNVLQAGGDVLLVPQFTLAADTSSGNRPGFSRAANPEDGARGFEDLVAQVAARGASVRQGRFGADMQVCLVNDGPVTFWLRVPPPRVADA